MDKLRLKDLENIMGVYPPFFIKDVRIDEENECFNIEIDAQQNKSKLSIRSRFKSDQTDKNLKWQHIRLGHYTSVTEFTGSEDSFQRLTKHLLPPFFGQAKSAYSSQLKNAVLLGHNKSLDAQTIAELTGQKIDIVKDIIVSAENEKLENKASSLLPLETDPIWIKLIKREFILKTRSNPLRMLLHKLELNELNNSENSNLQQSVTILRTFFIKHKAQLSDEYRQLGAVPDSKVKKSGEKKSSLKPDHPVWHSILTGEVSIISSNLAFNLYLSRLKNLYTDELPAADKREIIVDVMRYLKKHLATLKPELISIMRLAQQLDSEKSQVQLPVADSSLWSDIIEGRVKINTSRINLNLLLVKLKSQSQADNGDNNQAVIQQGRKELHQFFNDNQRTLKAEIQQITQLAQQAS